VLSLRYTRAIVQVIDCLRRHLSARYSQGHVGAKRTSGEQGTNEDVVRRRYLLSRPVLAGAKTVNAVIPPARVLQPPVSQACRWGNRLPIANVVWCAGPACWNSTGSMSVALQWRHAPNNLGQTVAGSAQPQRAATKPHRRGTAVTSTSNALNLSIDLRNSFRRELVWLWS
jgi:hypothetical protein